MGSSEMDPGEEEGENQPILFDKMKTPSIITCLLTDLVQDAPGHSLIAGAVQVLRDES